MDTPRELTTPPTPLSNCPFCGRENPKLAEEQLRSSHSRMIHQYQVICSMHDGGCGASGGWRETAIEATGIWQQRTKANE